MTNIFSGQLYKNLVRDNNQGRLQNFNVNRYQKTILQQADQGRREKTFREGLEFHQAFKGDLQTKLNEVTEKLNNLYRRYLNNQVAFKKVAGTTYSDTSQVLNNLRNVDDPTPPGYTGYPGGVNGIVPSQDPERVKNYSWNPYFGSKAIDESENVVVRTHWQQPQSTYESAYEENGAFWSTISYLWGWDLDRINATYATTDTTQPLVNDPTDPDQHYNNLQVNVTAIQPNRPDSPPLRAGDRFPITSNQFPANPNLPFPSISVAGIRPGGADYNHAQVTAGINDVGEDSLNWGWEFDDLPVALEVTGVERQADGSTKATGYKVVYDIPSTHPEYARLRVLDGTEPLILDAPEKLVKERIDIEGFDYTGFLELGGDLFNPPTSALGGGAPTGGAVAAYQDGIGTFGGTGNRTNTDVTNHPRDFRNSDIATMSLAGCSNFGWNAGTRISFDYRFAVIQHEQFGGYSTAGDDGFVPDYKQHYWGSGGGTGPKNSLSAAQIAAMEGDQPGSAAAAAAFTGAWTNVTDLSVGSLPIDGGGRALTLGAVPSQAHDMVGEDDPFHNGSGFSPGGIAEQVVSNTGTGDLPGSNDGAIGFVSVPGGWSVGDVLDIDGNTADTSDQGTIAFIDGNNIYMDPPFPSSTGSGTTITNVTTTTTAVTTNDRTGDAGGIQVADGNTFTIGDVVDIKNAGGTVIHSATVDDVNGNFVFLNNPIAYNQITAADQMEIQGSAGAGSLSANTESVKLRFPATGSTLANLNMDVVLDADVHDFYIEIANFKIVSYDGNTNGWENGLYNGTNPGLDNGALNFTDPPAPLDDDVINKYSTDEYNFTQFLNEYDNSATTSAGLPADLNDILRSPYEYGMLNIGEAQGIDSGLEGELFVDINDRRLNFQYDDFDNGGTQPDWSGSATTLGAASGNADVINEEFYHGANVQEAYQFGGATTGIHPTDACAPASSGHPTSDRFGAAEDSDPYTDDRLNDAGTNHISTTPADPMHTSYIGSTAPLPAGYYNDAPLSASNDTTNTDDRIAGTTGSMEYTMSIPTTDLNILKKENNVVFNFGSIADRNYTVSVQEPYMEFRTVEDYKTVPRYRVDTSGNIFDRFGKGFYDPTNADDLLALADLYPTEVIGDASDPTYNADDNLLNGQVSNHDMVYDNAAYYDATGNNTVIDRMSRDGDDYNLFDYVPDLRDDPNNVDPEVFEGELYVGSLPTNFYYYREILDQSVAGPTQAANGQNFNNDGKPALNFDGTKTNTTGQFTGTHKVVTNTTMPAFDTVVIGHTEQKALFNNSGATTSYVTWDGFPGLGSPTSSAQRLVHPLVTPGDVTDPGNALGSNHTSGASMQDGSDLILDMLQDTAQGGHMLVYEIVPAAEPPTVFNASVFANSPDGSSSGNGNGQPVYINDVSFLNVGDSIEIENQSGTVRTRVISHIIPGDGSMPSPGGSIRFDIGFDPLNASPGPPFTAGQVTKYQQNFETIAHAIPLPMEPGYPLVFDSYNSRKTVTRTGSENKAGTTVLHVDNANLFDVDFINPPFPATVDIEIGEPPVVRTIAQSDIDTSTHPHTITVTPALGTAPGTDIPVKTRAGQFTVQIDDGALTNSQVTLNYDAQGTTTNGVIAAIEISPEMDRVGTYVGDDARTLAIEPDAIGPEYFADSPNGYVEPDAQLGFHLVSRDTDGNVQPRRLKEIRVQVESGEQMILGAAGRITQNYTTNDLTAAGGLTDANQDWPIAVYDDQNNQLNTVPTDDLGILVGYYQGIQQGATTTTIPLIAAGEFQIGDLVTINGEQRNIQGIAGNTITLDIPLANAPLEGDRLNLDNGLGDKELKIFINRSFAMSTNAPVNVEMVWEDYEVTGYPPEVVRNTAGNPNVTEPLGFTKTNPGDPVPDAAYDNHEYIVVGDGRSGGSTENEFTAELKRIVDDPTYRDVFRHNLFRDVFITNSVNDSFNDLINSKLLLNWDRRKRSIEIQQTSFMAYFKSF